MRVLFHHLVIHFNLGIVRTLKLINFLIKMNIEDNNDNLISFNTEHTLTVDDALMLMLNLRGELVEYEIDGDVFKDTLSDRLCELQDDKAYALESAGTDLKLYKYEGGTDNNTIEQHQGKILSCEKDLQDVHDLIKKAETYSSRLMHEIAKAKAGRDTAIVLDNSHTDGAKIDRITKFSFTEWWKGQHDFNSENTNLPITSLPTESSTETKVKNNRITTYLLAKSLAQLIDENSLLGSTKLVKQNGTLNISALVKYVLETNKKVDGQAVRSLTERIKAAEQETSEQDIQSVSTEEKEASIENGGNALADHNLDPPAY